MTSQQTNTNKVQETTVLYKNPLYNGFDEFVVDDEPEDKLDNPYVSFYMKVGTYMKIGYLEFMDTPYLVLKQISQEIDERISKHDQKGVYLNWEQIATLLGIAKAFGGSKDETS